MINLDNYIIQGEPDQKERGFIWHTAIGLQQTDGLKTSDYLITTANRNINGDITLEEAKELIDNYYEAKPDKHDDKTRTEEADKVSARITQLLAEKTFSFSPAEYISIHRDLFEGIYRFAGKVRDYNISKKEWALNGETVYYARAGSVRDTLEYDFKQEKEFSYKGLSMLQTSEHIAKFTSGLWQIHAFGEGNTRTTAVFTIKYLRSIGFDVANDIFAENAWYFRNALVRANYNNLKQGIHATQEYLNRFFANLLLGEKNELRNRELRVTIKTDVPLNVPLNVPLKMNKTQHQVVNILKENPDVTAKQIAELIGVSDRTVKRAIEALKAAKTIERSGSKKIGSWVIKE